MLTINIIKNQINKLRFLYRPVKYIFIAALSVFILLLGFLIFWYNHCLFPYDQDFLQQIYDSAEYKGNDLEKVEFDLIRDIGKVRFNKQLTKKDHEFLTSSGLRTNDFYIDENPYGRNHPHNLKYSTGKIFYYTYQKNALVLKSDSSLSIRIGKSSSNARFVEFDAVFPGFGETHEGTVNVYFTSHNRRTLLSKRIQRENKPDIRPFRYSNILSSISFYLKHPGRSVLTDKAGWEKMRVDLPSGHGVLEIEFKSDGIQSENNYLFLGSPAVYSVHTDKRNDHVNIVYLIFDTFAKNHIDLYEYYDIFSKMTPYEAYKKLGSRKIITPAIDKYTDKICLFEHMFTAGQVTRPAIVPLWTSQTYTKSRLPVFRNIVTDENREEFNKLGFASLGDELSKHGYFSKQISCNAQGHGVSGVGVDLGFDENYDYTMETTQKPENFRRIMEFLKENQNRKFFLYSHINVPHSPKWIPMRYFLSALPDSRFNIRSATMLGNIRYLNDSLARIMGTIEKLRLLENTVVIITADHSGGRPAFFRGEVTDKDIKNSMREPQSVAAFHSRAIYSREGRQHLFNSYMNIPWLLVKPDNLDFQPGKIDSFISSLDISPTLLDIALNKENQGFSGKSFKNLLQNNSQRNKTFSGFIPLVGRFQRGFIIDGKYKYWINLQGLYKYRTENKKKYIMQQEYLYDLENDPYELNNLVHDSLNNGLLNKMRRIYLERYIDYPDKNFIQISPSVKDRIRNYSITASCPNGRIIYPKIYGDEIIYRFKSDNEIIFTCAVKDKAVFFSFETDPADSPLKIGIYRNGVLMDPANIFTSVEFINVFGNPIQLNDRNDFYFAREPGKTGLEIKEMPIESVYYSRIPLNYWMEMNLSDKDIILSPGIKEVLRGWGYIQ
ncbi:MAG: sulfatase-like hydrolase/transferase [Spirochaetes bacterium]|nr:sulfatase-like hydrolase/transferase [Spirochaetota bacterium]